MSNHMKILELSSKNQLGSPPSSGNSKGLSPSNLLCNYVTDHAPLRATTSQIVLAVRTLGILLGVLAIGSSQLFAQCTVPQTAEATFAWDNGFGVGAQWLDNTANSVNGASNTYTISYTDANGQANTVDVTVTLIDPNNRNADEDLRDASTHPYDTGSRLDYPPSGGFPDDPWDSDNNSGGAEATRDFNTSTDGVYGTNALGWFMMSEDHTEGVTFQVTFSKPVALVDFEIFDIDFQGLTNDWNNSQYQGGSLSFWELMGNSFQDELDFSASNGGTNVPLTLTAGSASVVVSNQNVVANYQTNVAGNLAFSDVNGSVSVSTGGALIDQLSMTYSNGPADAADEQANPSFYPWWSSSAFDAFLGTNGYGQGATNGVSDSHGVRWPGFTFCVFDAAPAPDLDVTKTSNVSGSADPGDNIEYTITVTNNGAGTANNVVVSDALPSGVTYVGSSSEVTFPSSTAGSFTSSNLASANPTFDTGGLTLNTTLTSSDIPAGAQLTDFSYTVVGSSSDWLSDITLVASTPAGTASSLVGGSFGGNTSGSFNESRGPISQSGTALGTYSFVFDDGFDGATGDENTVTSTTFTINYTSTGNTTQAAGTPPNLLTSGDAIDLAPGESLTITFDVTVDNPLAGGITELTNNVSVTSDEITTPETASVTDPVNNVQVALGDVIFEDLDGDGVQDLGEPGIEGVIVELFTSGGVSQGTTTTDANGNYSFTGLGAGDYYIRATPPAGYEPTPIQTADPDDNDNTDSNIDEARSTPAGSWESGVITLSAGGETGDGDADADNNPSLDLGFIKPGSIGNYVWLDENNDGAQDAGEPGIPNTLVELYYDADGNGTIEGSEASTPFATTYTDANGGYVFPNLDPGLYEVQVPATGNTGSGEALEGMVQTTLTGGTGDFGNKDDAGYQVSLTSGAEDLTADFGYNHNSDNQVNSNTGTAAIGDRVWIDADGDGAQDPEEIGVSGVELTLYSDPDGDGVYDNVVGTTTTDENGNYLFDGLTPDAYVVEVTDDAGASHDVLTTGASGYTQTGDPDEFGTTATAADNQTTKPVVLAPGDVYVNADFGYDPGASAPVSSIGNTVWFDTDADGNGPSALNGDATNGNGAQNDVSEYGIEGVTVSLIQDLNGDGDWDAGEPIIATDVTDANGQYIFEGLPTTDGAGSDDFLVWVNDADNVLQGLSPTYDADGGTATSSGAPVGATPSSTGGLSTVSNLTTTAVTNQDFGYTPAEHSTGEGFIGDYVWFDADRGEDQDAAESGIEGVLVELLDVNGTVVGTTTTDENGYYYFGGLSVDDGTGATGADYQVRIAASNFTGGGVLEGMENTVDPGNDDDNLGATVTLTSGSPSSLVQDFGYAGDDNNTLGSIGNTVFEDLDADGVRETGENGIDGVTVDLYRDLDGDGVLDPGEPKIGSTTTSGGGQYSFTNLPLDTYIVDVSDEAGLLHGYWHSLGSQDASTNSGDDENDNSKADPFAVTLDGTTPNNNNVDFGYYLDPASVGNYVWEDTNANGLQDDGETGVNGVEVTLTITYPDATVVTLVTVTQNDASGNPGFYEFPNLLLDEDFNGDGSGSEPSYSISVSTSQDALTSANYAPTVTDVNSNGNDLEDSDNFSGVSAQPVQGNTDTAAQDPETNENTVASYDFGLQDVTPGAIGNYVWLDENNDGAQDAGEPGIPNTLVELYYDADGNGVIEGGEASTPFATTYTDANGGYLFPDLTPGVYEVQVPATGNTGAGEALEGMTQTPITGGVGDFGNKDDAGYRITLSPGEENLTADFGYNHNSDNQVNNNTGTAAIGDRVWIDSDGDGAQDPNEIGVSGVVLTLYSDPDGDGVYDNVVTTTTTDENGNYLFDGLTPDAYVVGVTNSASASHDILTTGTSGYTQTGDPDEFGTTATAADNLTTNPVVLAPGDVFVNADFGYEPGASAPVSSIGNTVWFDTDADGSGPAGVNGDASNGDGVQDDATEYGIEGVTVSLIQDLNGDGDWDVGEPIIATDVTDANGQYQFDGLPTTDGAGSDDFLVWVNDADNVLQGLSPTYDADGGTTTTSGAPIGSTPASTGGLSVVSDLTTTGVTNQDFGFAPTGHDTGEGFIGDYVWFDADRGEDQDPTESGIEGVVVELLDVNGEVVATTTTDENGYYYFGGLSVDDGTGAAGADYQVRIATANFASGGVLEGMENTVDPGNDDDNLGATVTLTSGSPTSLTQDFGYAGDDNNTLGSIGNTIFEDRDADGVKEAGENGLDGVTVDLYRDLDGDGILDPGEPKIGSTVTSGGGLYSFTDLPLDTYIVDVSDEAGLLHGYWHSTSSNQDASTNSGNDSEDNSKADPFAITLDVTTPNNSNVDFGYYIDPSTLGNYVWLDNNGDGFQDAAETPLENVQVTLTITYPDATEVTVVTQTDANGFYSFPNLLLDEDYNGDGNGSEPSYVISIDTDQAELLANGFVPTTTDASGGGIDDTNDSDDPTGVNASPVQGITNVDLASGAHDPSAETNPQASYDFGFQSAPTSLGNRIWLDDGTDTNSADDATNLGVPNNGVMDGNEPGVENVTVYLFATDGSGNILDLDGDGTFGDRGDVVDSTLTDSEGYYLFDGVAPNTYKVFLPQKNFISGGALENYVSSMGEEGSPDTNNRDLQDNGIDDPNPDQNGIFSAQFTLTVNGEPASGTGVDTEEDLRVTNPHGAAGDDNDSNLTVDFGFSCPSYQCTVTDFYPVANQDDIDVGKTHGMWLNFANYGSVNTAGAASGDLGSVTPYFNWQSGATMTVDNATETITLTGTVRNNDDPTVEFTATVTLFSCEGWDAYVAAGNTFQADFAGLADPSPSVDHESWLYCELSGTLTAAATGKDFDGETFTLDNSGYTKKVQYGRAANDKDGDLGLSGWYDVTRDSNSEEYRGDGNIDITTCQSGACATPQAVLQPMMVIEGAYEEGSNLMRTELNGSIPLVGPDGTTAENDILNNPESDIVDWVEVSLVRPGRVGVTRSVIEKRAALLRADGGVVDVDGRSPITFSSPPGEYYIMIEHRNHLNIVTETAVMLENGKINGMSFRGQMICGDVNKDGQINADDRAAAWNNRNQTGYQEGDVNLDGKVDMEDVEAAWQNRNKHTQE